MFIRLSKTSGPCLGGSRFSAAACAANSAAFFFAAAGASAL
eukprot:COSAG04_NODE_16406_length_500_cov_0.673317_2_plen_40_part_01